MEKVVLDKGDLHDKLHILQVKEDIFLVLPGPSWSRIYSQFRHNTLLAIDMKYHRLSPYKWITYS